jgi:hypothetical protein
MGFHKDNMTEPYECPESEAFLDNDSIARDVKMYFHKEECIRNYIWGNCSGSCKQEFLNNSEYYLLQEYALPDGFAEYSVEETQNHQGQITTTKNVVQGFFVDENRTRAIISDVANPKLVPEKISSQIQDLIPIDHIYEGYEYLLIKANNKILSFDMQLYQSIKELVRLIDLHVSCRIEKILTNEKGTLLVFDTGQTKFLLSGMLTTETEEIERAILTSKLEEAKPFFEFKAIKKVDWSKLKDDKGENFEKLTETLLPLEPNLTDIKSIGKTNAADRGRDFLLTENTFDTFGSPLEKKWLVQCKFSDKSISTKTIPDWISRAVEHSVDGYWLITNNDLTPDLFDQLNDVPKNKRYKIETRVWQRNTFDIKFATRPEVFATGLFFN